MKKSLTIIVMLFFVSVLSYGQSKAGRTIPAPAPAPPPKKVVEQPYGFTKDKHYLGPSIGFNLFSMLNSTVMLGVNYEYGIDENFGVGGIFRYQSFSEDDLLGDVLDTYIVFGVEGNLHFKDNKWDPFIGLILGYANVSTSLNSWAKERGTESSGKLFFSAHITQRYWVRSNIGVQARLSFGSLLGTAIEFGLDYKF